MAKTKTSVLKATSNAELISFAINSDPTLVAELDLPVQGQDLTPYGKLYSSNQRFKNAFLNMFNLVGLTYIKRNGWENPWDFTDRGMLNFGQQIREIIVDLCNVYDYNAKLSYESDFIATVVPNVLEYVHELNFQKFYKTTTSDEQVAMAIVREGDLLDLIIKIIGSMYTSWLYDKYIVNKYMLCRRIVDGTITAVEIDGYGSLTARQRVSAMKNISNKMIFMSPNYNPAGLRRATPFEDQIFILNTDFEADMTTEVLATSFFRNDAEFKSQSALIDGFGTHDSARLTELLGSDYTAFTDDELSALANVPAVIISREWFMDYMWAFDGNGDGTKETEFYNPETLKNNHFLHVWAVFSTSPFENAVVFTKDVTPAVSTVTVSPSTATMSAGTKAQFSATVATTGFANKAVTWKTNETSVKINEWGALEIPLEYTGASEITVTATSIYDSTKTGTATITVAS